MPNSLGLVHPGMLGALASLPPSFFPSLLTIQSVTETRSPTGAVISGWADVADMTDLPCRIAPVSGSESRTPQQVLTQEVQRCVVPLDLPGVTTKHRAVVDGEPFDIVSVDFDGQQQPGNRRRLTRLTLKVVA